MFKFVTELSIITIISSCHIVNVYSLINYHKYVSIYSIHERWDGTLPDKEKKEPVTYKISLANVTPTEAAWAKLSMLSKQRYLQLLREDVGLTPDELETVFPGISSDISMQQVGWDEAVSRALVEKHAEKLKVHQSTIDGVRTYGQRNGLPDSLIEHLANVFALGILVGELSLEISWDYAITGIQDIESET